MKKQSKFILFALILTLLQIQFANASANDGDFDENQVIKKQIINLKEGSNFVSFYLVPKDASLKSILKPLTDEQSLIVAMDETGNVFWPDRNMDDIGEVNFEKGYTLKVNKDTQLEIEGTLLNYPFYININTGWNLISYPSSENKNAMDILKPLIENNVLNKVRDENGLEIYFSQNEWKNEIGNFVAGKAYEVSLKENAILMIKPFACGEKLIYENREYKTVEINDRCWMSENLNVGKMINGTSNQSNNSIIEKYCINNIEENCEKLGGLYQWNEAMNYSNKEITQGICPNDWHIPSDYEWFLMENYVDSSVNNRVDRVARGFRGTDIGEKLKENGESGFEAKITGYRYDAMDNPFLGTNVYAYFWTSTRDTKDSVWIRSLNDSYKKINRNAYPNIWLGYSVRCIKD